MAKPAVRLRVVELAFAIGALAILGRAAQVQVVDGARYAADAQAQRTKRVTLPAPRGGIYDRIGLALAATQELFHVGVAPNELRNPTRDAAEIAKRLGLSRQEVNRRLRRSWAYFYGPYTSEQVQPLRGVHGVHLESDLVRFYPNPDFARPVIGRPGAEGRPAGGIERVLDSLLTGIPGSGVVLRDRQGREYESPSRRDAFPIPGHDVYLTLDADLQEICQQSLEDAVDRLGATGGDVVVLNPRTGEVLALASTAQSGASGATGLTDVFEPGSTAKIFAAAALLTHGLATATDSVFAENGTWVFNGRTIKDDHPEGWLTLQQVVERSSNIGIVKASRALTPEMQYSMLRDFGLGTPTGVEYPAESPGILKRPYEWSGTTAASLAIGYEVAVTALQLAQAYAAIGNDGVMLRPSLVYEVRAPDGRVVYRHVPEPVRRVVPPEVAAELRAMLRGVVYSGGTGSTAALMTYEVAGKTGTARRAGPNGYVPGSHTATFASLFPAQDPQLVMVVKLDDPRGAYARVTAAPVTRAVLEQVLAARTGALDRTRLNLPAALSRTPPAVGGGTVPYVIPWPLPADAGSAATRVVPNVRGLSLRSAARRLHGEGLRVQLVGWGTVARTEPDMGSKVAVGSVVRMVGTERLDNP